MASAGAGANPCTEPMGWRVWRPDPFSSDICDTARVLTGETGLQVSYREAAHVAGSGGKARLGGAPGTVRGWNFLLNNRNNNRRRGRNNRNQGGGNAANRIDNRARGNAPQLLDKYKKLAQDAHHNGDRVQQEYYLQFADHYFRVIADNKARQEEARAKRDADRGDNRGSDGEDDGDGEDSRRGNRRSRSQRGADRSDGRGEGRGTEADVNQDDGGDDRKPRGRRARPDAEQDGEDARGSERDGTQDRRPRRTRSNGSGRGDAGDDGDAGEIDAAVLPPSISADDEGEDAPPPRRRRTVRKPVDDGSAGDAREAVG